MKKILKLLLLVTITMSFIYTSSVDSVDAANQELQVYEQDITLDESFFNSTHQRGIINIPFTLWNSEDNFGIYYIDIYDSFNKRMYYKWDEIPANIGTKPLDLAVDTSGWAAGVYYVKYHTNNSEEISIPFKIQPNEKEYFNPVFSGKQTISNNDINNKNPLSAWKLTSLSTKSSVSDTNEQYNIKLEEVYIGNEGKLIAKQIKSWLSDPSDKQQWVVMKYSVKNNGNYPLSLSTDILNPYNCYDVIGNKIPLYEILATAQSSNLRVLEGETVDYWIGVLIPKSAGYPYMGVDNETAVYDKYYALLDTNPNYIDVTLDRSILSLNKGKEYDFKPTISSINEINQDLIWTSSDNNVATVDANGKVTAVAPGITTITVKIKNTSEVATCVVMVPDSLKVTTDTTKIEGIGIKGSEVTLTIRNNWTDWSKTLYIVDHGGKYSFDLSSVSYWLQPGVEVSIKMGLGEDVLMSETTKVLSLFSTNIDPVDKNTTMIKSSFGAFAPKGTIVTAYVDDEIIGSTTVGQDGSYSIKIPKQSVGKQITIKMMKSGYETKSMTIKVLDVFNTLKVNEVTKNTTMIKGTGVRGAKVTAYVHGKSIGSTTVGEDGSYSITIPKQSAGKEITIEMTKSGYASKSMVTKVLDVFNTLKVNTVTKNTTTIKGSGVKGAKVTAYVSGKSIGSATVAKDGSYSIKISKQGAGKEITIKMTKSGYATKSMTTKVLNVFNTLKVNTVTKNTTTIKGTGVKGAKVTAYVGGKSIGSATVGKDGSYSIKISKQSAGKEITIKMTKSGYATKSTTTKVLNVFNTLKVNTVTKNTTTIKGTGVKGAKVTAYVSGKSIGSATVGKDGSYSIKISKQKAGKEITIKMTKSGYATKSTTTKVLNVFNTLKVNTVTKNTTTIKGTGVKGAKVTVYVSGKSIGSATVAKDGSYSIKISKQSAGKEIMIKMTKSGYATKSINTKVKK